MTKIGKTPAEAPVPAYYYLTLATHPGKVFRIACEEVPNEVFGDALFPKKEEVWEAANRSRNIGPLLDWAAQIVSAPPKPMSEPVYTTEGWSGKPILLPWLKRAWNWLKFSISQL